MILPHPSHQLAGCSWLPRFSAKVRLSLAKRLPFAYRLALASPVDIDRFFLRHFRLSRQQFFRAVEQSSDDEALVRWFRSQPTVTETSIKLWNRLAPRLGKKGYPGYLTRHLVKWVLYPKSIVHPVQSLFEAIEQDEQV